MTTTKTPTTSAAIALPSLIDLLEAGVQFGHERSKQNPKMKPFVFTQRERIGIINLDQTRTALASAATFLQGLSQQTGSYVLFVGTKRQAAPLVRQYAEKVKMPYVTKRWLGGTLTNFSTILKSIEKLEELKAMEDTKDLERLTKKEKAIRRKEISRLEEVLEGLRHVRTLPTALVVIGAHDEKLAVREANQVGIPIVGIVDTNANPDLIDYPIPANDDAVRSIEVILATLTSAFSHGQQS
jgi:small subunit ribosomal protein S2